MYREEEPFIVAEGTPYIALCAFLALFAAASGMTGISWLLFLLTFAVTAFFRNPHRNIPEDPKAVVCPADGKVLSVEETHPCELFPRPSRKISIFMSPFDVHVNRAPVSGILKHRVHRPGKFHVASRPKASLENERMELRLDGDDGLPVAVVQIAGRMARRIVCYPRPGDRVRRGERFGMIRFGSRVELFLPLEVSVSVRPGQRVKGGTTVMGYLP